MFSAKFKPSLRFIWLPVAITVYRVRGGRKMANKTELHVNKTFVPESRQQWWLLNAVCPAGEDASLTFGSFGFIHLRQSASFTVH